MARKDPYRNPRLYDLEYRDQTEDIDYYVDLAARAGGPVLELGCGNGRLSLPMARAGVHVDGVDNSAPMLDDLQAKLHREESAVQARVRAVPGDFIELRPSHRYPLVLLPFNAIHHCRDHREVLGLLDGVQRALAPGGRLALDCYLPDPTLYNRDPNKTYEHIELEDPRTGRPMQSWERSWYDPLRQIHHVIYAYKADQEPLEETQLDLRVFYPQELLGLLDLGGFRPTHMWSDFQGSSLTGGSLKLVAQIERR